MQKIFSENLMIMNPSGSNVSNINGDVTINVIRYKIRVKFTRDKSFSDIWLYINIPQNSIYCTTYVINKPIGMPIKKEKIMELLRCLFYETKSNKTVFEENLLKPFKESPKFLSYKWKANQYKILMFNLKNMFKAKSGVNLNLYIKNNNSSQQNQEEQKDQEEQTSQSQELEITDEILKQNIEKEFKETVSADAFNKLKNITKKLSDEVKKTNSPLKKIDKENIKEDLKNLFTKIFDKKKEFLTVLKNLKILDQTFDTDSKENIAQISEQKKSFYKELKNIDLFLENYLGNIK